jgi:hypothetical protein
MRNAASSARRVVTVVRWVARILSALFIILCLILFAGEGVFRDPGSPPLTTSAIIQLTIMGIGLAGLALAWKWELIGALVALAAYVVNILVNPKAVAVFPIPFLALLFFVCWWLDRRRKGNRPSTERN